MTERRTSIAYPRRRLARGSTPGRRTASATRGLQDLANNRYKAPGGEVMQTQQGAFQRWI